MRSGAHSCGVRRWLVALVLAMGAQLAIAAEEQLILDLSVNQQARGEFTVYRDESGDFFLRAADLVALGLAEHAARGRTVQIGGVPHVSLRSLGAQQVRFDEKKLSLEFSFETGLLLKKAFDLMPRRLETRLATRESSAFVNYRLSAVDDHTGAPLKLALATEVAIRRGDFLFRQESIVSRDGVALRAQRLSTQVVYDRLQDQQRIVFGDHTASTGDLGSTLPVGGISLSKAYQLTPYMIRQPLAGFAGAVSGPSQVEVRMGGVPVFREQVAPGPFELRNIQQYGGSRDVEVVVRDALGREQVVAFPYYFSDQSLRGGLNEYSYSLGALRTELGVKSNRYGPGVFTAFHRYGVNDQLTVGARGELAPGLWNFGPSVLYRDNRFGLFSASVAASARDGRNGWASSLGYQYQAPRYGAHVINRRYSDGYAVAQDLIAPLGLRSERGAGASITEPGWGTLSVERTSTHHQPAVVATVPDSTATRFTYSYPVARQGSLFATFARVNEGKRGNEIFVGFTWTLDHRETLNVSAHRDSSGASAETAQIAKSVPVGEGYGYRVGYERDSGGSQRVAPFVQYNGSMASVTLDASTTSTAGAGTQRIETAVAGALTYAGGRLDFTRPIDDSFVAVQLAAPLEGVRVYSNNQEIGRTDSRGRLVVPNVGSFYETQIGLEEKDIPLDYTIGSVRRVVAPLFRSGSLVGFDVRRLRAVEGEIRVRTAGESKAAGNVVVRLARSGIRSEFTTGTDGRYYVEDLAPGRYDAGLTQDGRECRFTLDVPESTATLVVLPTVTTCD